MERTDSLAVNTDDEAEQGDSPRRPVVGGDQLFAEAFGERD